MQTCPHCGAENSADSANCSNCGQPMKADEPDDAATWPAALVLAELLQSDR
jgi:uncharacterized membrane protein YvbJ